MSAIKAAFLQALTGASGRIVSATVAFGVAVIAKLFAAMDWTLDTQLQTTISALIGVLVAYLLDGLAAYLKDQGTAQVQSTLRGVEPNLQIDGVPGPKTQAAAETAVNTSTLTP